MTDIAQQTRPHRAYGNPAVVADIEQVLRESQRGVEQPIGPRRSGIVVDPHSAALSLSGLIDRLVRQELNGTPAPRSEAPAMPTPNANETQAPDVIETPTPRRLPEIGRAARRGSGASQ